MSRLRSAFLLCLLAAASASGCVIGRYSEGQAIPAEQIPRIVRGETTKTEILDWFGAPQSFADATLLESYMSDRDLLPGPVVDVPFADVLVYRMTRGRLKGLVLLLYNQFRVDVASDTLVVFFDESDRVLYYGWRKGTDGLE
jgi:hypothetical protein